MRTLCIDILPLKKFTIYMKYYAITVANIEVKCSQSLVEFVRTGKQINILKNRQFKLAFPMGCEDKGL